MRRGVQRNQFVSRLPSTERKVREWPDRLDDAAERPEWLGSAHLVGGPPGEVDQRSHGKSQLHGGRGDDQPLLGACEVAPPLFRRHEVTVAQGERQGVPRVLRRSCLASGDFRL
jgi:hypothetical protein